MQTAPSARNAKHIIVGVDTGKTSAIACIDLNGRLVGVANQRYGGFDWFVRRISASGLPVVIASDKAKADTMLARLAAAFDSVLFAPEYDISVKRKMEFTARANVANAHERDALSAAMTAFNAYSNKLLQAEKLARENDFEDIDRLKAMVIRKRSVHEVLTNAKGRGRMVR